MATPSSNGSSFLRKAGHLYKKTGLGRSWRSRFFRRQSFRISHPKTSKVYDLAATLPSRTEDWIHALTQASTMAQTVSPSRPLTSHTSSSDVIHSSPHSTDSSVSELVDVPDAEIPDAFRDCK
ncbi:Hypothetical protein PHPALM_3036, partial [Phytophthora palmivora]